MVVTKIATCCYCGTKAALVLRGKSRHELSCGSCGAPLHAMKMLPNSSQRRAQPTMAQPSKEMQKPKQKAERGRPSRPKKRRKNNRFAHKLWEEVWDAVEDIFD